MSDFMDSEAEESGEELADTKEQDEEGEDDEDEETGDDTEVIKDLIDDNPIEEEDEDESDGEGDDEDNIGPVKKRKIEDDDDDDDVDDDDLDLIAENTGIKLKKKKHSRLKLLDSDDSEGEEHEPENERDAIAHDIFDKDEDEEMQEDTNASRPASRQSVAAEYTAIENVDEEEDDEGDEIDDFIVDDDGAPKKKGKKKRSGADYDDSALAEAQDIFGLEFDLSELDVEMDDDDDDLDEEDLDEEELIERLEQKKAKKKSGKKKLTEVFEPAEIERGYMTTEDNKIKITDIPERFQLRSVPVQPAEEAELLEEAEWIYKQAFMQPPISQQSFQDSIDPSRNNLGFEAKPVTAIPRIKAALSFTRKEMFEVPFIAMYRKEYVAPELKQDDLWKVFEWDEKWTQFITRKHNMKKLFEGMQAYQFEYTKSNPDMPLDEGFRLLDQEDIDRLENAQNVDELMDVYSHFQLYYGNDVSAMQQWKATQKKKQKKMKKKIIQVKKIKPKKQKSVKTNKEESCLSQNQENGLSNENGDKTIVDREKENDAENVSKKDDEGNSNTTLTEKGDRDVVSEEESAIQEVDMEESTIKEVDMEESTIQEVDMEVDDDNENDNIDQTVDKEDTETTVENSETAGEDEDNVETGENKDVQVTSEKGGAIDGDEDEEVDKIGNTDTENNEEGDGNEDSEAKNENKGIEEGKDSSATDENKGVEEGKDANAADENKAIEEGVESKDSETTDENKDSETTDKNKDSETTDKNKDSETTDENKDIEEDTESNNIKALSENKDGSETIVGNNEATAEESKENETTPDGNTSDNITGSDPEKEVARDKIDDGEKKNIDNNAEEGTESTNTDNQSDLRDPETGEILNSSKGEEHSEKGTPEKESTGEVALDTGPSEKSDDIDFNKNENEESEEEESEYEDQEIEVTDSEAENEEQEASKKRKLPRRRDLYVICKDNGLAKLSVKFGLTSEQFGENMRDNYQRHEPVQYQQEPTEAAEEFICNTFPSAEAVLSGARHMVAVEISRDPLVRQTVRQVFYERAKVHIVPTAKGKKDINDYDELAPFKYLKNKPVNDLHGEQFLKMCVAELSALVKIKIGIDLDGNTHGYSFLDEIKQLYHRDEFSHLVQEWNKQRADALSLALHKILYPFFEKEIKNRLLTEAKEFAMQACKMRLRNFISVAPYQPDSAYNEDGEFGVENESSYCRVLGCSFIAEKDIASFCAMLDTDGQVIDHLRLKYLTVFGKKIICDMDNERKDKEMETLKNFVKKHQPRVIGISAETGMAEKIFDQISKAMTDLEDEQQMAHVYVELVDGEVARLYQDSPRAENEFRDYPTLLRHAVSIARRLQEPLVEFAGLTGMENELLCLRLHPLQEHLDQEILLQKLNVEFISQVNMVGVDINRCLEYPHRQVLINYLCGLGPRKAALLMRTLRSQGSRLENRSQLVTVCEMGLQVFLNCAGFIRIEPSEINNDKYEVLDGTRIHPETYDWPRKMAIDALEYDEGMDDSNPSSAVEEILEQPDRLKDLDLDAFAEELARQGYGNRQITLYDIRDELINRFKDNRTVYTGLNGEEKFRLLTGETTTSLYVGIMVTSRAHSFAYKKPSREELDSANPTRNDDTSLWKCPFCLNGTFPDLSEVWTHFDNGSCPGKAIGVKTVLPNGIHGFIHTRNISDKKVNRPEERVKIGLTLYSRVLKIDYDRFGVDLTSKSSDLADLQKKFCPAKDLYFDQETYDKDCKQDESVKMAEEKKTTYLKRVIAHPSFKNITFKDAEKLLDQMEQGECIVRPSSKGADHLTVTWKVTGKIYQHIDIREEQKENDFSIGKSLWIDNEEYEDLDEILTRHINPLAAHSRELCAHKYFKDSDGTRQKLEEILVLEKRKNPGRIPYFFTVSKQHPGKFMIGYMPRNKPRVEFVSVTVDGFKYRGRIHANTNNLLKWFKEHFRDPVPGVGTPGSVRRTPYGQTPMSMMGSVAGTPYTPGSTPSDLISNDEAAKLMQQAFPPGMGQMFNGGFAGTPGSTPARSTPGYSTPAFSTPGGFTPQINHLGQGENNTDPSGSEFDVMSEVKFTPTPKFTPTRNFTPDSSNTPNSSNTPMQNYTPRENFTPLNNFTPVHGNFTPVQGNFTPLQNNFTPLDNSMFTPQNYTPSEHNFTPVDNFAHIDQGNYTPLENFTPPLDNQNYTPIENFTPPTNFTPPVESFTPENNFPGVEFPRMDFPPPPNAFPPPPNGFNPWMQMPPPGNFMPPNFQPPPANIKIENQQNNFRTKNKHEKGGGQKRKKR